MSCALETRDAWRFVCIDVIALNPSVLPMSMGFFFAGEMKVMSSITFTTLWCVKFSPMTMCHMVRWVSHGTRVYFLPQAVSVCVLVVASR